MTSFFRGTGIALLAPCRGSSTSSIHRATASAVSTRLARAREQLCASQAICDEPGILLQLASDRKSHLLRALICSYADTQSGIVREIQMAALMRVGAAAQEANSPRQIAGAYPDPFTAGLYCCEALARRVFGACPRTSRILAASSSGLNGFSMNSVPGLSTPILIAASSV
jgi:hypothetical protein